MTNYQKRMAAYAEEAARLAACDNTADLERAVRWLRQAECIVIGGAAGLSAAGGMDYMSRQVLEEQFPALAAKGYDHLWQALWDPARTETQRWAMTAAEVLWACIDYPVVPCYDDLRELVEGRDYFILTSNIDRQFWKAGFDPCRIFAPQGDVTKLQCSVPCCHQTWDGEAVFRQIAAHTDPETFACRPEDLPRCPYCGAPAVQNVRGPDCFVPEETMANKGPFEAFLKKASERRTVFLELGVGFNTPGMIRHPFQRLTWLWPKGKLIRMNRDYPSVPEKIRDKAIPIGGDIGRALHRMAGIAGKGA